MIPNENILDVGGRVGEIWLGVGDGGQRDSIDIIM